MKRSLRLNLVWNFGQWSAIWSIRIYRVLIDFTKSMNCAWERISSFSTWKDKKRNDRHNFTFNLVIIITLCKSYQLAKTTFCSYVKYTVEIMSMKMENYSIILLTSKHLHYNMSSNLILSSYLFNWRNN